MEFDTLMTDSLQIPLEFHNGNPSKYTLSYKCYNFAPQTFIKFFREKAEVLKNANNSAILSNFL